MIRRPPRSTRTDTLFPITTLFRPFARHTLIYAIVEQILAPWCEKFQINLTQAIEIFPGAPAQMPHRDQDMWRADKGRQEYMINVMWELEDLTAENGAKRLWQGRNKGAPDSVLSDAIAKADVMPRGTEGIFL